MEVRPPTTAGFGLGARLVLPALAVDAPLISVGAQLVAGVVTLVPPADVSEVGWWDGSVFGGPGGASEERTAAPAPGESGTAVIAGHVDSARDGPGAFYRLGRLRPGDRVDVVGGDGRIQAWVVSAAPEVISKADLPPGLGIPGGPPRLALITCGGPFDSATGHYRDNVIVYAGVSQ
jgi:hypothetical protein